MSDLELSIIVTLDNQPHAIPALLSSLEKQQVPAALYELVLVFLAGVSKKDLQQVENFAHGVPMRVMCALSDASTEISARNYGAQLAQGKILLFFDQDLLAGQGLLAAHLEMHQNDSEQTVLLGKVNRGPNLPKGCLTRWFMPHDQVPMNTDYPSNPFCWASRHCSIPRNVFYEIGGFSEAYVQSRAADIVFAQALARKGIKMAALPGHHAYIWKIANFSEERKRFFQEGYDLCRLATEQHNPEIMHYFNLHRSSLRFKLDELFAPFYIRACDSEPLDIRIHGVSCLRVFTHELQCGARAALLDTSL